MNIPVTVASIRVRPGDIIIGDADGVVVIPSELGEEVAKIAAHIEEAENNIRQAVLAGERLVDARIKFHYHQLQTKE